MKTNRGVCDACGCSYPALNANGLWTHLFFGKDEDSFINNVKWYTVCGYLHCVNWAVYNLSFREPTNPMKLVRDAWPGQF